MYRFDHLDCHSPINPTLKNKQFPLEEPANDSNLAFTLITNDSKKAIHSKTSAPVAPLSGMSGLASSAHLSEPSASAEPQCDPGEYRAVTSGGN